MSIIQLIRECGFLGIVMALWGFAGEYVRKVNPLRYFIRVPVLRTRRPRQECVWLRPSSRW